MFTLAHLSDLHATPVRPPNALALANKRLLGWISWNTKRKKSQRPEVLSALVDDLHEAKPDQIVITGDLTNVSLADEFVHARTWLDRIGPAERVSIVPGNHDAYVKVPRASSWDLWSEYMLSDPGAPGAGPDPADFPTVRLRGPAAIVGLCSARPTLPLLASGSLGRAQIERLERVLFELRDSGRVRVVLVHHPIVAGVVDWRRALTDAEGLRGALRRAGADLVLHGHMHRTSLGEVEGPDGPIPVVGVRSSSNIGNNPAKRAQYHVYEFDGRAGTTARIRMRVRGYDRDSGRFAADGERVL